MGWIIIFVVFLIALWLIADLILAGPSLRHFDSNCGQIFPDLAEDKDADQVILNTLRDIRKKSLRSKHPKLGLEIVRNFANSLSDGLETETVFTQVRFNQIDAEWAVAPNANSKRRVLFFHGGAFFLGSPEGHRKFSDRLSRNCATAVLSVNYKLLPEHARKAGIEDAQLAYRWILDNGPEGAADCEFLLLAGDSAGGNLAFMLSGWSRTAGLARPNAVIGFSPSLDSTVSSPTIKRNRKTDRLLGPSIGKLALLPRAVFLWLALALIRIKPANPLVSPLYYDLSELPPTLIQVSGSEMLLGEAIRYTNKASASGSSVELQIWRNQLHDWQLFNIGTGSAEVAWREVEKFVNRLH